MQRPPRLRADLRWLLYLVAFIGTTAFRFLTLGEGFPNDHFVYISGGWQMGFGEWPTRDWVDPGLPLMFAASAAAQAVVGPTLLAEALLVSTAFGLGAVLTAAAVLEMTASLPLAAFATLLEVVVFPRSYGYPKVLVYALALLCLVRYLSRPGAGRAVAMAGSVVVAFLFRHDHGLFLGVGGGLAILLAPGPGLRDRARQLGAFVGAGLLMVAPYVLWVERHGGLATYLRIALDFSRREAARQWHIWPAVFGDPDPLASALVYEFHAIPGLALLVLAAGRRHPRVREHVAQVVPLAVVAVMVNYSFIRDPLNTRLPDAIVPALMLAAWMAARALVPSPTRPLRLLSLGVLSLLFSASVSVAGDLRGNIERSDVVSEWDHLPRLVAARTSDLTERFAPRQIPTRVTAALVPFLEYLDRCTSRDDRLLVGGFLVELPFFAQRRFAAGQGYFGGSFGGEDVERLALMRLRGQAVPFMVIPSDSLGDFEGRFPLVARYVASRYTQMASIPASEETAVQIFVDSERPAQGQDAQTGWPCFVGS